MARFNYLIKAISPSNEISLIAINRDCDSSEVANTLDRALVDIVFNKDAKVEVSKDLYNKGWRIIAMSCGDSKGLIIRCARGSENVPQSTVLKVFPELVPTDYLYRSTLVT